MKHVITDRSIKNIKYLSSHVVKKKENACQ
jgi:hypothetical protein